ncbi:MAG: hypothetical protein AAFQ66_14170 [Pseudomonadota bacterium]
MLFVVTQSTLARPRGLQTRHVPRKIIGRGIPLWPKDGLRHPMVRRLILEWSLVRYFLALLPFLLAMIIWPDLALPISAAPLLMFAAIYAVEMQVLAIPRARTRDALVDQTTADRVLDSLQARAQGILTQLAAGRDLQAGRLYFVIEQSALARVPPLTLVSVQQVHEGTRFLDLTEAEVAQIEETLFVGDLTEQALQRVNLRQNQFLRSTELDPRTISAHARLKALAGLQKATGRS